MMKLTTLAVAACLLAVSCVSAAATPPTYGTSIYLSAVMRLPYAGIVENIQSWFNTDRMRTEFYDGMDVYVYRADLNTTWQVNPMNNVRTCFETDGQVELSPYVPDTTGFVLAEDAVQVNDQMCDDWQLSVTTLNKTSYYDLYVSRVTGMPVRYQMHGYDSLIGSHYDLYQLDYINFTVNPVFPANIFNEPAGQCGGFPGPGDSHMDPSAETALYFPNIADDEAADADADSLLSDEYVAYMKTHGKTYGDIKEARAREMQYMKHNHFVASHNRRYRAGMETYTVGLNFLADHTTDELAARRGKLSTPKGQRSTNNASGYHLRNYYDADLPAAVDWRPLGAVNPPQDQGICGSCWSFGSTGAIEGQYFLKYGVLKVAAEQELMDCSWSFGNNACDGGEDFRAFDWILSNGGLSFKENYGPYLMQDGYCKSSSLKPDIVIKSYVNVTEFDENALMDALASQGPMSVSIDASHPGLSFYTTGVYYDPACGSGFDSLDHSVSAVGYGTDAVGGDYWIVKNSWSTYWGDGGYIKMSRKNNNCGVATMPTYVVLE